MAADDEDYMLTTTDNPWNPYTQWKEWWAFDYAKGYHTPGLVARFTITSLDLSDADQDLQIKQAIDEIVRVNALGLYRKVNREGKIII